MRRTRKEEKGRKMIGARVEGGDQLCSMRLKDIQITRLTYHSLMVGGEWCRGCAIGAGEIPFWKVDPA